MCTVSCCCSSDTKWNSHTLNSCYKILKELLTWPVWFFHYELSLRFKTWLSFDRLCLIAAIWEKPCKYDQGSQISNVNPDTVLRRRRCDRQSWVLQEITNISLSRLLRAVVLSSNRKKTLGIEATNIINYCLYDWLSQPCNLYRFMIGKDSLEKMTYQSVNHLAVFLNKHTSCHCEISIKPCMPQTSTIRLNIHHEKAMSTALAHRLQFQAWTAENELQISKPCRASRNGLWWRRIFIHKMETDRQITCCSHSSRLTTCKWMK